MQHEIQREGYGVRLRPVRMEDAAFVVWLRGLSHAKGRLGDSAKDVAGQQAWLEAYFQRAGDYYFIIETLSGFPVGTQGVYDMEGGAAEVGRWIIRPTVQAALPSYMVILDFAFQELGLKELRATTIATNSGVISLNKKLGFEQFRTEVAERIINGEPTDIVHCVLRAETWARSRERLRPTALLAERLVREWEQDQMRIAASASTNPNPPPDTGESPGPSAARATVAPAAGARLGMLLLLALALALGAGAVSGLRARGRNLQRTSFDILSYQPCA